MKKSPPNKYNISKESLRKLSQSNDILLGKFITICSAIALALCIIVPFFRQAFFTLLILTVLFAISLVGQMRGEQQHQLKKYNAFGDLILGKPFLPSSETELEKFYMWLKRSMPRYYRAQDISRELFEKIYTAYGEDINYIHREYFGNGWDDYRDINTNLYDENAEICCDYLTPSVPIQYIPLAFCYQIFLIHEKTK